MMRIFRNGSAGALLLAAHACTPAQSQVATESAPLQQVLVSAAASDPRTTSTTAAIVIGRDELLRHGDTSLSDVLKRQPGITLESGPGKPATIRMRGMGGDHVAILLNGLPAPSGFSLESLSPDLIERIDIRRTATAETSAQAMAGTINVILRRAGAATGTEVKPGLALVDGYAAPELLAQHSGRRGALSYGLNATLRRNRNPTAAATFEEGSNPLLRRRTDWTDHQVEDVFELAPRLSWQRGAHESLGLQGYLRQRRIDNVKRERETVQAGDATAFPHADQHYATRPAHAYAELAWTRRLDGGARLALKLAGFHVTRDASFDYRGRDLQDTLRETRFVASGPSEREWIFNGSWRRPLWGTHTLAAGWEAGRKRRDEYRREQRFDPAGALLLASDEDYRATVTRSALFVQDEWDIAPGWSAYAGLRREDLRTTGQGNAAAAVDVDAGAWSPIFQTLYRPVLADGDSGAQDGFRLAVSRTYKAPNIVQLMPRRYAVDNNNNATNPDQLGNPRLRPELALGIDLSWERSIGKDHMFALTAFHKRIRDITLTRVALADGVWTATPDNAGNATVRGLEFDARARRGPLGARANLARNWSRIDSLPGPDNRIAGQPAWSGNLGLDVAAHARLDLGGSFTVRGRAAYRAGAWVFNEEGMRRQLDLYAVWRRDATSRLRLSASDLLRRDYRETSSFDGARALLRATVYRPPTTWRLTWEQTL